MAWATDRFIDLSSALTGFSRVELLGTGVSEQYEAHLDSALPDGLAAQLAETFAAAGSGAEAAATLLGDPRWGAVARNLTTMWYTGVWNQMPDDWRAAYGAGEQDVTRVVSSDAYLNGLQWLAAGAHPAGARQQGYAAWALPPESLPDEPAAVPADQPVTALS